MPDRDSKPDQGILRVVAEFCMPGPGDALHRALEAVAEEHGGELVKTGDRAWTAQTDAQVANERDRLRVELERVGKERDANAAECHRLVVEYADRASLIAENEHLRKSIANSDRDHWFEEAGRLREVMRDANRHGCRAMNKVRDRTAPNTAAQRSAVEELGRALDLLQAEVDSRASSDERKAP